MSRDRGWLWFLVLGLFAIAGGVGGAEVYILSELEKRVQRIADGIEVAEGYWEPGSRPARNNNPGDLTSDITGAGIGKDGPFIIYASYEDGRIALEKQVRMMLNGSSRYYSPGMTLAEVGEQYSPGTGSIWAANVAGYIGVPVNTPLDQIPV